MGTLNIVMTTDENYVLPTMVTISSMLSSSKKDNNFTVYILCSSELNRASRDRLISLEKMNRQIEIRFAEINDSQLATAATTAHIAVASYYRLYISRLIKEDRCLFLDGDMLIRGDLSEVYNTDIEDYYAAGVKDLGIQYNMEAYAEYARYLEIPSMDNYVNAGFMLFNLKKIRKDGIDKHMIEAISNGYKYMDQDIINKFFYGKIKHLPLIYDFFTEYYGSADMNKLKGYTKEELRDIEQNACVLHFTGFFKPWMCSRMTVNILWWNEAEKILDRSAYNTIMESAKDFEKKSDWKYILEAAEETDEIIIFGYSEIGKTIADRLLQSEAGDIVAFADNDIRKEGLRYREIPVASAKALCEEYPNALYIISSQNGFIHIEKQLNGLGIDSHKIIRYIHKDRTYYARLDEKYRAYEEMMRF